MNDKSTDKATGLGNVYGRLLNCRNDYQGSRKRILCVCSAGLLRSPTAAVILSQDPWNFNTRAVGIEKNWALIPIDEVLIEWADEFVCMNQNQEEKIKDMLKPNDARKVHCLHIEDEFDYMNVVLVDAMKEEFHKIFPVEN